MIFRKSAMDDAEGILKIMEDAKAYLLASGVDQWQNGYPNRESTVRDIENGESYVLTEESEYAATACLSCRAEPTYERIYDGEWLTGDGYMVVHRIAASSDFRRKGAARAMLLKAEELCREHGTGSIRIDTHEDNRPMQGLLRSMGYIHCGTIYISDGSKRLAFEKLVG